MTYTSTSKKPYSAEKEDPYSPEEEKLILKKIENLLKFFQETGIKYKEFNVEPEDIPKNTRSNIFDKKAYPNNDSYVYIPGQHNIEKWMQAVRNIYYEEKNGSSRIMAIRKMANGWSPVETYDFLNWLKYYESGTHMKYKSAQLWYENGAPGYFLHVKPDNKETNISEEKDIGMAQDAISENISAAEKKHIIEKQRSKIIGRLDSTEKLLRTHDGQIFAGKEFESLLEAIYQLKKKVQMINKISLSTKLYEDMIVREANILNKKGFNKAANLLFSLSQANNPPPQELGTNTSNALPAASPAPPQQSGGAPGGLPSMGPGMAQNPPESAPNDMSLIPKGIREFLNNLNTSNITSNDELEVEDTLDVNDADDLFITEAQEITPPPLGPTKLGPKALSPKALSPKALKSTVLDAPQIKTPPLEVKKDILTDEISPDKVTPQYRDFDNIIDSAFANIKISDIVFKLEDLAKIFKTREIPRQLAIIDMMLDSVGLAAYFPSLSEATNKALESNNYISTRVDDILAKLHGSMDTKEIDLRGDKKSKQTSPEIDGLRQNLKTQEDKEKSRKKLRKDQANQELESVVNDTATATPTPTLKETPEIDIEEDLNKPIPITETPISK